MRIEKQVEAWVAASLIEPAQGEAIVRFEAQSPRRSWAMYSVVGLGVLTMMSGVLSIIAANWEDFSQAGKLVGYFLLLSLLGGLCVKSRPGVAREALLLAFALLLLCGIGLVGALYHLESDGWTGIAFWLLLALPVTLLADSILLPNIWFAGFYGALALWAIGSSEPEMDRVMWSIAAMYGTLIGSFALAGSVSVYLLRAARSWAVLMGLGMGGAFASIAWQHPTDKLHHTSALPSVAGVGACVLAAIVIASQGKHFPRGAAKLAGLAVLLSGLMILPPFLVDLPYNRPLACLVFLLPWSAVAAAAATADRKRLFDFAIFIVGARLVGIYFEVIGSLAATGIGLIFSGALILTAVYAWHRFRARLAAFIRERL